MEFQLMALQKYTVDTLMQSYVLSYNTDIIVLPETHLDSFIEASELNINI